MTNFMMHLQRDLAVQRHLQVQDEIGLSFGLLVFNGSNILVFNGSNIIGCNCLFFSIYEIQYHNEKKMVYCVFS